MPSDTLQVRFWGVRGSLPVSGPEFARYGGSTICFEIRCGDDVLLFDAGSGIMPAGRTLKNEGVSHVHLFFSHCHYDHIMGFPFLTPLFDPASAVDIWSGHLAGKMTTEEMLLSFMRPPWFPVEPSVCPARVKTHDFVPGDVLRPYPGVTLRTALLDHPGGAIGYRVEWAGRVVAVVTDTEHTPGVLDPNVLALIDGADLFLYDTSYLEEEMGRYRGFGHSSWQQAVLLARAARAQRVALIHHAPFRTDADLARIGAEAEAAFPGAFVARENQVVTL
ncbi:MAG: MBL fold metallo-hydrolase [Paracoccaceae bacterium]